jgi:hypothetical protein
VWTLPGTVCDEPSATDSVWNPTQKGIFNAEARRMTTGVLTMIAYPIVIALTLRFTSWAEQALLRDEHRDDSGPALRASR